MLQEYVLEDAHQLEILGVACEAWDRKEEARKALDELGTTFIDRFEQPKARPEVRVELANRAAFIQALRELGLDGAPLDDVGRPAELPRAAPLRR